MGERKKDVLRVNFDRKLKLEFHGTNVTGVSSFRLRTAKNLKAGSPHICRIANLQSLQATG